MVGPLPADQKISSLTLLRDTHHQRFQTGKASKDLDDAIDAERELLQLLPLDSPQRARELALLAYLQKSRFQIHFSVQDIDDAVKLGKEAVDLVDKSDPGWANIANNLGHSFFARYQATKKPGNLDEAIAWARQLLAVAPPKTKEHNTALINLNERLTLRFEKTGSDADQDEAVELIRQLLSSTTPGTPDYATTQARMAYMLVGRFEKTGFWRDLEEAIRIQRLTVDGMAPHDVNRPEVLANLASTMEKKYSGSKEVADLKETVALYRQAVMETPGSQTSTSSRGGYFHRYLANAKKLGRVTTSLAVLDKTLEEVKELMNIMPGVCQEHINLWFHGDLLSRRYELSSQPDDLYAVVLSALGCAPQLKNQEPNKAEKGETSYDVEALRALYSHVESLRMAPSDNYIMHQVSKAMHYEYCKLVESGTKDFISALVALEKDVTINVEIVGMMWTGRSLDDMRKEIDTQLKFSETLGAKTFQTRIKMLDTSIQSVDEQNEKSWISTLSAELEAVQGLSSGKPLEKEKFVVQLQSPSCSHSTLTLNQAGRTSYVESLLVA